MGNAQQGEEWSESGDSAEWRLRVASRTGHRRRHAPVLRYRRAETGAVDHHVLAELRALVERDRRSALPSSAGEKPSTTETGAILCMSSELSNPMHEGFACLPKPSPYRNWWAVCATRCRKEWRWALSKPRCGT